MSLGLLCFSFFLWKKFALSRENTILRAQVTSPICTGQLSDASDLTDVHPSNR